MPSNKAEIFLKLLTEEIKNERSALGLSQDHLAVKSGVDRGIISRMERLERTPSILGFFDLAQALDVPLSVLVERAEARLPEK